MSADDSNITTASQAHHFKMTAHTAAAHRHVHAEILVQEETMQAVLARLTGYIGSWMFRTSKGGICSASDRHFAPGPRWGGAGSWICLAMWAILKSKEYTSHPSNLHGPITSNF